MSSNPGLPTREHNITSGVSKTSGHPNWDEDLQNAVLYGDAFTSKKNRDQDLQEVGTREVKLPALPNGTERRIQKSCEGEDE